MIPQWMLRRVAERAIEVWGRYQDGEPSLKIHEQRMVVTGGLFATAYDKARAFETSRSDALTGREDAVTTLRNKMRAWAANLVADVPGFDRTQYGDKPYVPSDVVTDAESMMMVIAERESEGNTPPFYAEELKADLQAAIDDAKAVLSGAQGRHAQLANLRADARKAAEAFYVDLLAFRRALAALIGTSHPDYRTLRTSRTAQSELLEEAPIEGPTEGEPAESDEGSVGGEVIDIEDDDDEPVAEAS